MLTYVIWFMRDEDDERLYIQEIPLLIIVSIFTLIIDILIMPVEIYAFVAYKLEKRKEKCLKQKEN